MRVAFAAVRAIASDAGLFHWRTVEPTTVSVADVEPLRVVPLAIRFRFFAVRMSCGEIGFCGVATY